MTYFFETYGCEMNIAESASVEQILISRGWKKAESVQLADMVVINTCSVRGSAEERIFGRLGFFSGLKKVRMCAPDAKRRSMEIAAEYAEKNGPVPLTLVVMGCMAERLLKSLQKQWPCVDYVVGTFAKNKFGEIIQAVEEGRRYIQTDEEPVYVFAETSYEEGAFSTFVPIMHGCNNFCSYCIVPYVRGREVSRPLDQILHELDVLGARGVKEITLLGQNVNSYNDGSGENFPSLLEKICRHLDKTGSCIEWIRFESSNPKDFSDELIETIARESRVCRGLHIAVQHGSDAILKAMNRKYTRSQYLSLVEKIRARIPDVQLTTDIMLGFPGETDEDFEQVASLMRQVEFESAFMYYYNPREGTPAARMENQIPLEVKKERLQRIIDIQLGITRKVMEHQVGKTVRVLADIVSRDNARELLGKTGQNERVAFESPASLIGKFAQVRIDSLNGNTFRGTLES
ncbi:tRNA (N6-isopentenyl adenosine(37)-C2)-methylthiotransferase MiaB [Treponema sp.]|uniref:tRNA (N6-isopentenyl adenosine(37)-C2)-methylthiotransferase MiaB n=1 Tax=Treponema sp. TaxID=166 RepID=UPI003F066017